MGAQKDGSCETVEGKQVVLARPQLTCLLTWHLVATIGDIKAIGASLVGDVFN